jgi:hypothetical protein
MDDQLVRSDKTVRLEKSLTARAKRKKVKKVVAVKLENEYAKARRARKAKQ